MTLPQSVSFSAAPEDLVRGGTGPIRNRRQEVVRRINETGGEKSWEL